MPLTNLSSRLLWLPANGPRATSVTLAPPGQPPWTHIDVQLSWLGNVTVARAYCEAYRFVRGDQSGNLIDLRLTNGWVEGLISATFTLVAEGTGYVAAVVKLTTLQ